MIERRQFRCMEPASQPVRPMTDRVDSAKLRGKGRPKKKRTAAGM